MEKDNSRGQAVVETLKSDSVVSLAAEYLELGVDTMLESETLKDIPLVNSVVAIYNVAGSIRDKMLTSKLLRFMTQLSEIPQEERIKMVEKLNEDEKFSGRAGSAVIEILDRLESDRKPELAAIFFACYARNEISFLELRRILLALERIPSFDIDKLETFSKSTIEESLKMDDSMLIAFVSAGLGVNNGGFGGGAIISTSLCHTFVNCLTSQGSGTP